MISMTKNDPISSTDRNQNTLQNFKMRVNENCVSFRECKWYLCRGEQWWSCRPWPSGDLSCRETGQGHADKGDTGGEGQRPSVRVQDDRAHGVTNTKTTQAISAAAPCLDHPSLNRTLDTPMLNSIHLNYGQKSNSCHLLSERMYPCYFEDNSTVR